MTNSRNGELTYHREWSATAAAASSKKTRWKAGPLQDPSMRKCATHTPLIMCNIMNMGRTFILDFALCLVEQALEEAWQSR